jgi:glycosyltransferase involved in cell wall biosynthesis
VRIAFVATSYPRFPGDASGHFVRAEALAAVRAGHDVHVLTPGAQTDVGISTHVLSGSGLFRWPGAVARARENPARALILPVFWLDLALELRSIDPDHVVAHWLVPCAYPVVRADEIVCHGADVRLLLSLPRGLREHIVSQIVERASLVRFVATSLRAALLGSLSPELGRRLAACSRILPPAIDVGDGEDGPPRGAPARYVLGAGRLVVNKRYAWAIEACHEAGVPLVLLGDGPEEARLRLLAASRGADVTFAGRVPRARVLGWLRGAAALVHPSAEEAAPTIVLEARACGVPVVATPAGDVERWSEHDAGVRIGHDPAGLRRHLEAVLHARP